ncbi:MAG: NAD(P)H-dependent oxidoreductase [Planctomycetes bacterium]|nr:NAD(P)H-dependent oxidoreductase [Planctomycetota bacterium]
MQQDDWIDVGSVDELAKRPLRQVVVGKRSIALSFADDRFGAISGTCNHVGGPLGDGKLDGDYVVCPWHYYKFERTSGAGEPGYEADCVPKHDVKVEGGRVLVSREPVTKRSKLPHAPHPVAREPARHDGPLRVLGISATAMDPAQPRTSTSELLLQSALDHARSSLGLETQLLRLAALKFRACEGFYSKSARACTWPCSITQMDPGDQMEQVYEGIVHWADVILVATPIRWGAPSSLYQKMIERMNCVQNQITIQDRVLIRDKVAGFIITGGQDNVQAVAGSLLGFFAEIGCVFPPFPYVAHSRGWSAEDMENNVRAVQDSAELRAGTKGLLERAVALAQRLRETATCPSRLPRGGRKAHRQRPGDGSA